MVQIKELPVEYKAAVFFGLCALVLSLLVGVVAQTSVAVVFIHSLILLVVFALLGYVLVFVLKKFVPEVYALLSSSAVSSEGDSAETDIPLTDAAEGSVPKSAKDAAGQLDGETPAAADSTPDAPQPFVAFSQSDYPKYETESLPESKLGKHIVKEEKKIKYEPRIMAEAIRTMMSRDAE